MVASLKECSKSNLRVALDASEAHQYQVHIEENQQRIGEQLNSQQHALTLPPLKNRDLLQAAGTPSSLMNCQAKKFLVRLPMDCRQKKGS